MVFDVRSQIRDDQITYNKQDHLYYDLYVQNNSSYSQKLVFQETKSANFLSNPSEYFFTVLRFTVDSVTLPQVIATPNLNTTENPTLDPNLLIQSFTLSYFCAANSKTYNAQQFLVFQKQNQTLNAPPLLTFNSIDDPYYNLYSMQQFMNIVNNALLLSFNNLVAQIVADSQVVPSLSPPFFSMDPQTYILTLNADVVGYDQKNPVHIDIFMNASAYSILGSQFNCDYFGENQTAGKDYKYNIFNNFGLNLFTLNSVTYLQAYGEYSTFGILQPISAVVLTTSFLPVAESLITPVKLITNQSLNTVGTNNDTINSISDFSVAQDVGNEYKSGGEISYTVSSEYRLFDLQGNTPLSSIQVAFYYKTKNTGRYIPVTLGPGSGATIKCLFRHKSLGV